MCAGSLRARHGRAMLSGHRMISRSCSVLPEIVRHGAGGWRPCVSRLGEVLARVSSRRRVSRRLLRCSHPLDVQGASQDSGKSEADCGHLAEGEEARGEQPANEPAAPDRSPEVRVTLAIVQRRMSGSVSRQAAGTSATTRHRVPTSLDREAGTSATVWRRVSGRPEHVQGAGWVLMARGSAAPWQAAA